MAATVSAVQKRLSGYGCRDCRRLSNTSKSTTGNVRSCAYSFCCNCIRVGDLYSLVSSETRSLSGSKGMATFRKRKRTKGEVRRLRGILEGGSEKIHIVASIIID